MTTDQRTAVAPWEDGRRQTPGDGRTELWHFEASLMDGTSVALGFCLVDVVPEEPERYCTAVNIMVTTPAGEQHVQAVEGTVRADAVGTDRCLLPFGANTVDGDLHAYAVHVETDDGAIRLDLQYDARTDAYRPGVASPIRLDGDPTRSFSVLFVARCPVRGARDDRGRRRAERGRRCRHARSPVVRREPMTTWHHWVWGRLATEHFTAVLFDLVSSPDSGSRRIPVLGEFDAAGELVFDNDRAVEL